MDSATSPKPAREKRSLWGSLIFAVCTVMALVVGLYVFVFGGIFAYLWLHAGPGPFDRKNMEAIVEQVRRVALKPGEQRDFKLDHLSDPKSLHPSKEDSHIHPGEGFVWARISSDGKLTVVIETNYLGHAGSFGFVYSDEPLKPVPSPYHRGYENLEVHGELNEPRKKIDDHWWEVQFSLD